MLWRGDFDRYISDAALAFGIPDRNLESGIAKVNGGCAPCLDDLHSHAMVSMAARNHYDCEMQNPEGHRRAYDSCATACVWIVRLVFSG